MVLTLCLASKQCRALSAAIFDGDWNRTGHEWLDVPWVDQWGMISNGELDISTSAVTYNMERDVLEVSRSKDKTLDEEITKS